MLPLLKSGFYLSAAGISIFVPSSQKMIDREKEKAGKKKSTFSVLPHTERAVILYMLYNYGIIIFIKNQLFVFYIAFYYSP